MNNTFKIFPQNDKESAAAEAGEHLNQLLIENKAKPVLLMVSGGSALAILDYVGKTALGPNLTVSVLDERFSQDPAVNNFAQLQKTEFYKDAFEAEASFFGTLPRKEDTMEALAKRWEENLRKWREENPMGLIVATLGMGPDGHTGGVMPYPENAEKFNNLFESKPWVKAYDAGNKNPHKERVTTTLTFLKQINFGFAFVCGQDKKENLDKVIKKQGEFIKIPALAWHNIENVSVFTDLEV
jgi:6-phosphogluconolactonase/glucosamine-6-phosphate isomerase/deaminase